MASLSQGIGKAVSGLGLDKLKGAVTEGIGKAQETLKEGAGVVVDSAGMGVGWPGWVFSDGQWTAVPDDRLPEMVLRVTLGESAETIVTYPPNSMSCLTQPLGTFPTPIPGLPNPALLLLALTSSHASTVSVLVPVVPTPL